MSKQGEINKSNVLSLEGLKQKHEDKFKMEEVFVELDGEMLSYKIYSTFPQTKKDEYYRDLMEFMIGTANEDEEYLEIKDDTLIYSLILIIDKFTDLDIPSKPSDKVQYAGYLADFDILIPIINSFEDEELEELMKEANEMIERQTEKASNILDEYKNQSDEIEDLSALKLVEKELEAHGE